jgi:hypothetical protein
MVPRLRLSAFVFGISILAASLTAAAPASAAQPHLIPQTGTTCGSITCLHVNGTGLHVNYATVEDVKTSGITGQCTISDTSDGNTYYGPQCKPGQTWRLNFNRNLKNGSKICGSISGLDVRCLNIHS